MMKNVTAEINLLRAEIARLQHVLDEARAEIDTANEDGRALRCMMMPNSIATEATTMPRIAWFVISYAVAVALAISMRSAGYDQFAILITALVVWIILPFVISKACALFVLGRMHRHVSRADGFAEKTAQATKESPPVEQIASLA